MAAGAFDNCCRFSSFSPHPLPIACPLRCASVAESSMIRAIVSFEERVRFAFRGIAVPGCKKCSRKQFRKKSIIRNELLFLFFLRCCKLGSRCLILSSNLVDLGRHESLPTFLGILQLICIWAIFSAVDNRFDDPRLWCFLLYELGARGRL